MREDSDSHEGGPINYDPDNDDDFEPVCLLDTERCLVVTEEIVTDVLSLFQNTFVPLRSQMLINACKHMENQYEEEEHDFGAEPGVPSGKRVY